MELKQYVPVFIVVGLLQVLTFPIISFSQDSRYSLTLIIYDFSGKKALFEHPSTLPLVVIQKVGSDELKEKHANYDQTKMIVVCEFSGLEAGEYEVKVLWKGVQVYQNNNVSLHENLTLTIRCNVTLASFTVVDRLNRVVSDVKIKLLHQETVTLLSNVTADHEGRIRSLLPFGDYTVVIAFMSIGNNYVEVSLFKQSFIRANSSGTYVFTIDGKLQKYLTLDVFPLDIELLTNEGIALSPEVIKKLKLILFKNKEELLHFTLNQSRVYVEQLPSGTYTLKIFWCDYCFDVRSLYHSSNVKQYLKINLNSRVEIRFVDESNIPLVNATVTIITPWREEWNLVTDMQGRVSLMNVPYGNYTVLVRVKEYPQAMLNVIITHLDYYKEIIKGFLTVTLRIVRGSAHDKDLPEGIRLRLSIDESIVNETTLKKSVITLSNVPKGLLKMRLEWQGIIVGSLEELLTSSKEIVIECEIYKMKIALRDLDNHPIKGCVIKVSHPNGTMIEKITDVNGMIYWKYLPKGEYKIAVLWNGTVVHEEEVHLFSDLIDKVIIIKLKTFYIKVVDIISQPIPGVEILLKPLVSEKMLFEYNMSPILRPTTSLDSSFLFRKVFLPIDTYELIVKVRGMIVKVEIVKLGKDVDEIVIKCPVLALPLGYVITKYDIPLIAVFTIIVIMSIMVLVRYWRLIQLKRIFVERVPQKEKRPAMSKMTLISSIKQATTRKGGMLAKIKVKEKNLKLEGARTLFRPPVKRESYGKLEEFEEEYVEYEEYEELFE